MRSSSMGKGADHVGKVLYKLRLYPRASGRLRLLARTPGPGKCCVTTSGPEGTCAESGSESEIEAFALEDTHECIILSVPASACALSCAALRMACWARTRPRAWPVSCANRGALSFAIQWRTSTDAGPKCPVRACMPSG
eukprot:2886221-Amphidinium_carterae.1